MDVRGLNALQIILASGFTKVTDLGDIPDRVDVVDCFRRSENIPPIADRAIEIGAKVLWMQLGVVNHEAEKKAREAGLDVVMNRCMKIEFARLFGGLHFMGVNTRLISAKRPQPMPHSVVPRQATLEPDL